MSVQVDTLESGVRRIRIDRPDARNAIDAGVRSALHDALVEAREDGSVRAILLGGMGGMFSAGGDLPTMVGLAPDAALARMRDGHRIVALLWTYPKPVIAAVERFAVGAGAGVALLADRVLVDKASTFGFPFARLGLIPDWGLCATLPRRIGAEHAARLFADGASIKGGEAVRLGIADTLCADGAVMEEAEACAVGLTKASPGAFAAMKARLRGDAAGLDLEREARDQVVRLGSAEFAEGYAAFREKRDPRF